MKSIPLIKVRQWLPIWDEVTKYGEEFRRKPEPHFYVGSVPAGTLRALSGVLKRTTSGREQNQKDIGIQRRHDEERSAEISDYLEGGFPWSTLKAKQKNSLFENVRMPGWLPTAIVANVKISADNQPERLVAPSDYCVIEEQNGNPCLCLPESYYEEAWMPTEGYPIEIIDGQHRLMAFDPAVPDDFELPVVLFHGLDLSWQAYLFYVINIKPKKINPSLAFDLYPMLRNEDWLERIDGPKVYRETRAQEIVEFLWGYHGSPFYRKLNLLGEPGSPYVKQATFVRNLVNTILRPGDRHQKRNKGGFFGCLDKSRRGWTRVQQCALLTVAFKDLFEQIAVNEPDWLSDLSGDDPLFDRTSLLNTDQGIRAYLHVLNDMMIVGWDVHKSVEWENGGGDTNPSEEIMQAAIETLKQTPSMFSFIQAINRELVTFKWLSSDNSKLEPDEKRQRMAYKGSSGYGVLRKDILEHLSIRAGAVAPFAQSVLGALE